MTKRNRKNVADILAALALVFAIIVAYTMSSCSASRHTESSLSVSERMSAIRGMVYDSTGISIERRSLEDAMSSLETYSITIFDTSHKDTTTNSYPIKALINGTKQTDKTSVSSQVSADSSKVCERDTVGVQEEIITENDSVSDFDSRPDLATRIAMFVLIIALLVAIPYAFRYVIKKIL